MAISLLGKSESVSTSRPPFFPQVEKKFKVYARKSDGTERAKFEMAYRVPDFDKSDPDKNIKPNTDSRPVGDKLEEAIDNILLEKYVPPSVVINQELEILQFKGSIGRFLTFPRKGKS